MEANRRTDRGSTTMSDPLAGGEVSRRLFLQSAGACSALGVLPGLSAAAPANAAAGSGPSVDDLQAELAEYGFIVLRELISRGEAARAEQRVRDIMSRRSDANNVDQHVPGFLNVIEP